MPELKQQSCILCACKHVATARSLMLELAGYPENHFWITGELNLAEAHMTEEHPEIAKMIRSERKRIEQDPQYVPDWKTLVLTIAGAGDRKMKELLETIEAKYKTMTPEELLEAWNKAQT